MPASVYVSFDAPEGVPATPRRLHAALSAVLDLPPDVSPARAARFPTLAHRPPHGAGGVKPYSLGELSHSESRFGAETHDATPRQPRVKRVDQAIIQETHLHAERGL